MIATSFSHATLPNMFKLASVIPVHKKENKSNISNYRPISSLPVLIKKLERAIYLRPIQFILLIILF